MCRKSMFVTFTSSAFPFHDRFSYLLSPAACPCPPTRHQFIDPLNVVQRGSFAQAMQYVSPDLFGPPRLIFVPLDGGIQARIGTAKLKSLADVSRAWLFPVILPFKVRVLIQSNERPDCVWLSALLAVSCHLLFDFSLLNLHCLSELSATPQYRYIRLYLFWKPALSIFNVQLLPASSATLVHSELNQLHADLSHQLLHTSSCCRDVCSHT